MMISAYNAGTFLEADASSGVMQINEGSTAKIDMSDQSDKHAFFESAVSRMMDRLYGAAMRFTRNSSDAEDLMAESLEKAWNKLETLRDRDKFDGWIMRILSNTYISQWRRQKKHEEIFDDNSCPHDLDDKNSLYAKLHQPFLLWWGTPEQTFVNNLLIDDIEKALNGISDVYREVVIMVELLGFRYEEAALELDVPVGTVRSRLNRGRRMLQKALWENARDAGITNKDMPQEVN
jgi:RNA polymerase sigma factor (sigma-70 family)